jgi:Spy/CpxP family protein refolding chaperone
MKKLLLSALAALAIAALVIPAIAAGPSTGTTPKRSGLSAAGEDGPLRRAFRGAAKRFAEFREETPLTSAQREQIRGIVEKHRPEIRAQIEKSRTARQTMQQSIKSSGDDKALAASATRLGEAAREGALLRARLAREIRPVLTPEQRERLDSALESFGAAVGKFASTR